MVGVSIDDSEFHDTTSDYQCDDIKLNLEPLNFEQRASSCALVLQPVPLGNRKEDRADDYGADRDDQTESGELTDVAIVPQLPNRHGYHLRAGRIEQQGDTQFLKGDEKDVNPSSEQRGHD